MNSVLHLLICPRRIPTPSPIVTSESRVLSITPIHEYPKPITDGGAVGNSYSSRVVLIRLEDTVQIYVIYKNRE
jgi:hypothetical protein